ncbi:MAG: ABC transporter ATP-binding protein [Chloroflexi bacterium]|nr:ABC transporter ATP-binding protein [Chloroflexota bacterium]
MSKKKTPPPQPAVTPPPDDEILGKAYDARITQRLLAYIQPYRRGLYLALILMGFGTLANLAGPYLVKLALDEGIAGRDQGALLNAVLLYLLASGVLWISTYARVNLMARVGQSIIFDLRAQIFRHLQALSLGFYSRYSVGRVISRVVNDVGVLREMITWAIVAVARDLLTLFGIVFAMLALDARLSLLTFTVLPIMALATAIFRRRARESYRKVRQGIGWVNAVLAENISGVRVVQSFSREDRNYNTFQSTMAGGERIFELLDAQVEVQDAPDARRMPPIRGEVRFENVSFHYDDQIPVLEEINLQARAGQVVALVGETGAGKSTLVKLLSRFHDPTGGRVLVDGVDLRAVTQESLRAQMGVVLQDPFLFGGTVKDNLRFGRLDASDEEIVQAAQAVGAHEFITRLRDGYDTPVEEGGVILSGGQRQLISFARALLARPRILILDEATSSVDTQTERVIQAGLARLLRGRTAFVIAHRLSTITHADKIVVVDRGRIVEEGTHAELLARGGPYYALYSMAFEAPARSPAG